MGPESELFLVIILKALTELGGLLLFGQGVLFIVARENREANWVYRVFRALTSPVVKAIRYFTPKLIVDRHVPFVAFLILFWIWLALVYWMATLCAGGKVQCMPETQAAESRPEPGRVSWPNHRFPL